MRLHPTTERPARRPAVRSLPLVAPALAVLALAACGASSAGPPAAALSASSPAGDSTAAAVSGTASAGADLPVASSSASSAAVTSPGAGTPAHSSSPVVTGPSTLLATGSPATAESAGPPSGQGTPPSTSAPSSSGTTTPPAAVHYQAAAAARPARPLSPASAAAAEADVTRMINQARAGAGCAPLQVSPVLARIARAHSADMATTVGLRHNGSDGSTPFQRITAAGYRYTLATENIAAGQGSPWAVTSAWLADADHRRTLLDCRFRQIGAGVVALPGSRYGLYWTQIAATPA